MPKNKALPKTKTKQNLRAQEIKEHTTIPIIKRQLYISIFGVSALKKIDRSLKTVKEVEYRDIDKAAYYFVLISSITMKEGSQLLIESVIDVQSKNNQQNPTSRSLGNSSFNLSFYLSSGSYSGDFNITYPNETKIENIPIQRKLYLPNRLTNPGPTIDPIPYIPYDKVMTDFAFYCPTSRRTTFIIISIEPEAIDMKKVNIPRYHRFNILENNINPIPVKKQEKNNFL